MNTRYGFTLQKRYPLKTRAQRLIKRKPAMRDLLTAGVGSVDKKDTSHKREGKGKIKNRARNANCVQTQPGADSGS